MPVPVVGNPSAFAFLRDAGGEGGAGQALVVLNFGEQKTLRLALPSASLPMIGGPVKDALGGAPREVRLTAPGLLELTLPGRTGVALVPARAP